MVSLFKAKTHVQVAWTEIDTKSHLVAKSGYSTRCGLKVSGRADVLKTQATVTCPLCK